MVPTARLLALLFLFFSLASNGQNDESKKNKKTVWRLAHLLREKSGSIEKKGNPQIVPSPYGAAVAFNGTTDALFLNEMPLQDLTEFTVEMLFKPQGNAPFEQRILHIGEIKKDRLLLEIRAVDSNWYFDAFVLSGTSKKTLISEKLLHPLGQWHHVAFVVTPNSLTTFVNGVQELQEAFSFLPIQTGQTSIGVRMNQVSWFKGDIYKIRITPKPLGPNGFMHFKKNKLN